MIWTRRTRRLRRRRRLRRNWEEETIRRRRSCKKHDLTFSFSYVSWKTSSKYLRNIENYRNFFSRNILFSRTFEKLWKCVFWSTCTVYLLIQLTHSLNSHLFKNHWLNSFTKHSLNHDTHTTSSLKSLTHSLTHSLNLLTQLTFLVSSSS